MASQPKSLACCQSADTWIDATAAGREMGDSYSTMLLHQLRQGQIQIQPGWTHAVYGRERSASCTDVALYDNRARTHTIIPWVCTRET